MNAKEWQKRFVSLVAQALMTTPEGLARTKSSDLQSARKAYRALDSVLADICCEAALSAAVATSEQSIRGGQ